MTYPLDHQHDRHNLDEKRINNLWKEAVMKDLDHIDHNRLMHDYDRAAYLRQCRMDAEDAEYVRQTTAAYEANHRRLVMLRRLCDVFVALVITLYFTSLIKLWTDATWFQAFGFLLAALIGTAALTYAAWGVWLGLQDLWNWLCGR